MEKKENIFNNITMGGALFSVVGALLFWSSTSPDYAYITLLTCPLCFIFTFLHGMLRMKKGNVDEKEMKGIMTIILLFLVLSIGAIMFSEKFVYVVFLIAPIAAILSIFSGITRVLRKNATKKEILGMVFGGLSLIVTSICFIYMKYGSGMSNFN